MQFPYDPHIEVWKELTRPFPPSIVKRRAAKGGGGQLSYITERALHNRLDDTVGPSNWWSEIESIPGGFLCRLTIRLPDGSTVTKCGVGGTSDMPDESDEPKSGASDAEKRAGFQFGIGRHLYPCGVPNWHHGFTPGPAPSTNGHAPAQAEHQASRPTAPDTTQAQAAQPRAGWDARNTEPPRSGKSLYGRTKGMEDYYNTKLMSVMYAWGKEHANDAKMYDFSDEQVVAAWEHLKAAIMRLKNYGGEFGGEAAPAAEPALVDLKKKLFRVMARLVKATNGTGDEPTTDEVLKATDAFAAEGKTPFPGGFFACQDAELVKTVMIEAEHCADTPF